MSDTLVRAFPKHLASVAARVAAGLPPARLEPVGSVATSQAGQWPQLRVMGEPVVIPIRIYHPEPPEEFLAGLNDAERTVLACLYTRQHNGFVRQRWLAHVFSSDEAWVVPFVVQLLGEYVIEICRDVETFVLDVLPGRPVLRRNIATFLADNPSFLELTECRAVSYWACYYRYRLPLRGTYPALTALDALRGPS
ncbi:hypothetical protein [Phytoactinopolyspora limicola]|uniref:hypothetical protein n=1 Tax=Phytoactinopolyspora limicola TaxID=2715536 RepID=UPI00140CDBB9|nr:hypothetical protein [Phytoactinopolyspora limicola]